MAVRFASAPALLTRFSTNRGLGLRLPVGCGNVSFPVMILTVCVDKIGLSLLPSVGRGNLFLLALVPNIRVCIMYIYLADAWFEGRYLPPRSSFNVRIK